MRDPIARIGNLGSEIRDLGWGPFLVWLGRRAILAACLAGAGTFAGGTLGGVLSASVCVAMSSGGGESLSDAGAICDSLFRFGATCLIAAAGVGLAFAIAAWRRSRSNAFDSWEEEGVSEADGQPLLWVSGFILAATLVVTWLAGSPALDLLALTLSPSSWTFDGVLLMPPGFTAGTMATLLAAEAGLLILLCARSPLLPRTYALVAVAHLALVVCQRSLLGMVRTALDAFGADTPMLHTVETVVAAGTQGLTWSLAAHAAGLPLLMLPQVRSLFRPPPPAPARSRRPVSIVTAQPDCNGAAPAQAAWLQPLNEAGVALGTKYVLRSTFLAWPLLGTLRIDGVDEDASLTARLVPLSSRPSVQVWLESPGRQIPIVTMDSLHLFGLGNTFDVLDGGTRERLAIVCKPFAGDWQVYDEAADLAAIVARDRAGLGTATYVARADEATAGVFTWSNVMRPGLEIDLSGDVDRPLDRRLGLALGVLIFINLSFRAP